MDLESDKLEIDYKEEDFTKLTPNEKRHNKVMAKELKEEIMILLLKREMTTKKLFEMDLNIRYMRINYRRDFYEKWNEGLTYYFDGEWQKAKVVLEETQVECDYPRSVSLALWTGPLQLYSNTLIRIIAWHHRLGAVIEN